MADQNRGPAPIALFAYKRLDHLRATVQSLQRNPEAAQSRLFVFSDGAKSQADAAGVEAVREYVAGLGGFAAVKVISSPRNKGLSASIIGGVSAILQEFDRVIVVEDDLVVSEHFLAYMNDGLACYSESENVASIHGYVYPLDCAMPETFFLRGADCWGWATWRRAWAHMNPDGQTLLKHLIERKLARAFDHEGTASFTQMLKDQIAGRNDSWAVRWHASCFLDGMFTLYPGRSLVSNIGNDGSGTHSEANPERRFDVEVSSDRVAVTPIPVGETRQSRQAIAEYFRRTNRTSPYRSARRRAGKILRAIPYVRRWMTSPRDRKS
jgi:hypothetical protein